MISLQNKLAELDEMIHDMELRNGFKEFEVGLKITKDLKRALISLNNIQNNFNVIDHHALAYYKQREAEEALKEILG